jgi:hypothetical protein
VFDSERPCGGPRPVVAEASAAVVRGEHLRLPEVDDRARHVLVPGRYSLTVLRWARPRMCAPRLTYSCKEETAPALGDAPRGLAET